MCLNPCFDRTLTIKEFVYGGMNRVQGTRGDLSGKGYNVARTLSRLGLSAAATGFLFSDNGHMLKSAMEADGVRCECLWEAGAVRTNLKLHDLEKNIITEINEPGVLATHEMLGRLKQKIAELAEQSEFMVFSGSLPPGCGKTTYRDLIEHVSASGVKTVLDAEGASLFEGIKARPYLIKPNQYELETALGRKLGGHDELLVAAREIVNMGVKIVMVSLGEKGALITDGDENYFAPRVALDVADTVGAGDSMLAGLLAGLMRKLPLKESFAMAVASAAVCVMSEKVVAADVALVEAMLPKVIIQRI